MRAAFSFAGVLSAAVRVLVISVAFFASLFSFAAAESISRFHVDILIESDGRMIVTEDISYRFTSPRRGIYRTITNDHVAPASAWYMTRRTEVTLASVARNDQPEPYTLDERYPGLSVRIGDPNRTITKTHDYQIRYVVDGAINQTDEGLEIYWNATGNEWDIQMRDVEVVVRAAQGATILDKRACYAGTAVLPVDCEANGVALSPESSIGRFFVSALAPGQELTIAQRVRLSDAPVVIETPNWVPMLIIAITVWFVGLFVLLRRWNRHHATGRSVIAQYEPFRDFRPMFTGVLFDGRLDPRDITAGIIYLAQEGFISIKQTQDTVFMFFEVHDYEVTLLRPTSEAASEFQRDLLSLIFHGYTEFKQHRLLKSFLTVRIPTEETTDMQVGTTVRLSKIKSDASKRQFNQKVLVQLKRDIEREMVDLGFIEQVVNRTAKAVVVFVLALIVIVTIQIMTLMSLALALILLFIALNALIIIIFVAERRTRLGHEALDHLQGFKWFLSVTEKERYTFHNAPAKSPQQFMEYLPYAIAFGVEKKWAEAFKDVTIASPDWYSSDVPNTSFSAIAFGNELSSFSQSFVASTGSSGSSGGGSAGGGSGGGGGGSW